MNIVYNYLKIVNYFFKTILSLVLAMVIIVSCENKKVSVKDINTQNQSNNITLSQSLETQPTETTEKANVSVLKKILIIGDSITAGYGVSKDQSYPTVLENMFKDKNIDIKIINAGTSGSTSSSALSRLSWHLKSKPEYLILALGANDGLRGIDPEITKSNFLKVIDKASQNNIKVILAGMKMPLNYGVKYRKRFEEIFTEVANEAKIPLIPFLLEEVGGEKEMNLPDGIHPNEKGHIKIASTVFNFLNTVVLK